MQESSLFSWLSRTTGRKRVFVLIGSFVLVGLLVAIPSAVLAYRYVGFSEKFTSVLISAFGALSTVLLVIVTSAGFVERQMQTEREHQQELVREELETVLRPSWSKVKANQSRLDDGIVHWNNFDADQWDNGRVPAFELKSLSNYSDFENVIFKRCFGREPTVEARFEEHDERVADLATDGRELVETLAEPLAEYIRENEITVKTDEYADSEIIAAYVLSDVDELPNRNTYQAMWDERKDGFRGVAMDVAGDEIDQFFDRKRDLLQFLEATKDEFDQIRARLHRGFGVSEPESSKNVPRDELVVGN